MKNQRKNKSLALMGQNKFNELGIHNESKMK